ncbi:hypothetical protein KIL84_013654 [Mauremys mutica]|uniref:Uncharacterized protein n=1 Tax=Mauremys mutica TaxID=74926 RepID=A0A9D4ASM4_9SAUR|nr:hypothetical protein KIL84_013654 [Mauremys mutica]
MCANIHGTGLSCALAIPKGVLQGTLPGYRHPLLPVGQCSALGVISCLDSSTDTQIASVTSGVIISAEVQTACVLALPQPPEARRPMAWAALKGVYGKQDGQREGHWLLHLLSSHSKDK